MDMVYPLYVTAYELSVCMACQKACHNLPTDNEHPPLYADDFLNVTSRHSVNSNVFHSLHVCIWNFNRKKIIFNKSKDGGRLIKINRFGTFRS